MSNICLFLATLVWHVMNELASSKTRKYVLTKWLADTNHGKDDAQKKEVPDRVVSLVRTLIAIMSKNASTSMVSADGDQYPVSAYKFPERWWQLTYARRVYVSHMAVGLAEPYFKVDAIEGDILSPVQVAQMFDEFNSQQGEGYKIATADVDQARFNAFSTLIQMKGLCSGDAMAEVNESGEVDVEVAQILGIKHFANSACVRHWDKFDERWLEKWFMSIA